VIDPPGPLAAGAKYNPRPIGHAFLSTTQHHPHHTLI